MNSADPFEAIVGEHYEPLFRFAMSLTREESDARDLTQQTFYIWATKGHQLRDGSKAKSWLFTTLHRVFLDTQRRRVRFPLHRVEEVPEQLPALGPEQWDQLDSSAALSALARVDEIYRAAIALFYLEDCSYRDIASILGLPIGTVKSRISRGITQLKDILFADDSLALPKRKKTAFTMRRIKEPSVPVETRYLPLNHQAKSAAGTGECQREGRDVSSILSAEASGFP